MGAIQTGVLQDLVEQWKRTMLPTDVGEHLKMEGYEAQLQDKLISQLQAHQIGCVMAFLSAQELHANSVRTEAGPSVKLRIAPQSRLSYHLQVCPPLCAPARDFTEPASLLLARSRPALPFNMTSACWCGRSGYMGLVGSLKSWLRQGLEATQRFEADR